MRILMTLGLLTYWATHPDAVRWLVRAGTLVVSALAHAHGQGHALVGLGAHPALAGGVLALGSHWN